MCSSCSKIFTDSRDRAWDSRLYLARKLNIWVLVCEQVRADGVGQGRSDGTTHVHPLRGVLENLQYPSWLLQARSPIPPKVRDTALLHP